MVIYKNSMDSFNQEIRDFIKVLSELWRLENMYSHETGKTCVYKRLKLNNMKKLNLSIPV